MLKQERHALILQEINRHNKVLSSDLSMKLSVSEDTVRRDLHELAKNGKILKVHGGAVSKSFHSISYDQTEVYAIEQKQLIAQKAVTLLKEGMFILISGGTTCREFARGIPKDLSLTIFTPSLTTAIQLMDNHAAEVILLGGKLSKNARMAVVGEVFQQLNQVKMDYFFTGLNGFDPKEGMTDNDWEVVQLSKAMIKSAQQIAALSIAEKLFTVQPIKVADAHKVSLLITELVPSDERFVPFMKEGITIL